MQEERKRAKYSVRLCTRILIKRQAARNKSRQKVSWTVKSKAVKRATTAREFQEHRVPSENSSLKKERERERESQKEALPLGASFALFSLVASLARSFSYGLCAREQPWNFAGPFNSYQLYRIDVLKRKGAVPHVNRCRSTFARLPRKLVIENFSEWCRGKTSISPTDHRTQIKIILYKVTISRNFSSRASWRKSFNYLFLYGI